MFAYQGTAPLFVSTAILISILENKQINKKCIKQLCICAISLIIAVLLDEIFINLYNCGGNLRASGKNAFKYLFLNSGIIIFYFLVTVVETVYLQISYKQAMKIDFAFSKKIEQIIEEEYKQYFENQNTPVEFKVVGDTVYIGVLV